MPGAASRGEGQRPAPANPGSTSGPRFAGLAAVNKVSVAARLALALLGAGLLSHCSGGFGGADLRRSPHVINVSGWDPKERQRDGETFHENDVSALRANGAVALIARSSKGPADDPKFGSFLASAHRQGMKLGAYHYVTTGSDPVAQADRFLARVRSTARARGLAGQPILLVGDFAPDSKAPDIAAFLRRIEQRAGVPAVVYLENSEGLKAELRAADPATRAQLRRSPYWLALYGPHGTERRIFSDRPLTPDGLAGQYGVWAGWAMWQYGGVAWEGGRSRAKHYDTPRWRSPAYFGNLAQPCERNLVNGGNRALEALWAKSAWRFD